MCHPDRHRGSVGPGPDVLLSPERIQVVRALQQRLGGHRPQHQDPLGAHRCDFALQIGQAGRDFLGRRRAPPRRPAFDQRGAIHLVRLRQAGRCQHGLQEPAGIPLKRLARRLILQARLATHHEILRPYRDSRPWNARATRTAGHGLQAGLDRQGQRLGGAGNLGGLGTGRRRDRGSRRGRPQGRRRGGRSGRGRDRRRRRHSRSGQRSSRGRSLRAGGKRGSRRQRRSHSRRRRTLRGRGLRAGSLRRAPRRRRRQPVRVHSQLVEPGQLQRRDPVPRRHGAASARTRVMSQASSRLPWAAG
ncbi:hypothetical protein CDEF62S_00433 [Castellaniella defragrans]